MITVTQQMIDALSPNAAASANGRKISQKGGFVRLERSQDGSFYQGECTGSGSSNYITSADFLDAAAPVFRCSCPSRQFPCKHSLALLYEIMAGKPFAVTEIPDDILQKRAKKEARAAKAAESSAGEKAAPKINKAARAKKINRQLEGLELIAKLVRDLTQSGLGAMGGRSLNTYRELAKQLGDYYLPGPQRLMNRLILEIDAFQKDASDAHYEVAIDTLEKLWTLTKKSRQYLSEKLESGEVGQDGNLLFEELGGVWKLSELESLGLCKKNARLAQLAFWVSRDDARGEFVDTGCWADLDSGEIGMTYNYRPYKALKYVRQDDTFFGKAKIPTLVSYPGEGNRRIRWDGAESGPLEAGDLAALRRLAAPALSPEVKSAKNVLKNALATPMYCRMLRYTRIGRVGETPVMEDETGATIALGDLPGMEGSTDRLSALPDPALLENQALLGALWYDGTERRIKIQPLSILTESDVIRLLY